MKSKHKSELSPDRELQEIFKIMVDDLRANRSGSISEYHSSILFREIIRPMRIYLCLVAIPATILVSLALYGSFTWDMPIIVAIPCNLAFTVAPLFVFFHEFAWLHSAVKDIRDNRLAGINGSLKAIQFPFKHRFGFRILHTDIIDFYVNEYQFGQLKNLAQYYPDLQCTCYYLHESKVLIAIHPVGVLDNPFEETE